MTALHDKQGAKVIFKLLALIRKKLPQAETKIVTKFVRYYYAAIAEEELQERDAEALYDMLLSHWAFIKTRQADQVKMRVYNPATERHGWDSHHTVIEISQHDSPFLVDSVLAELNRLGLNIHFIVHVGNMLIKRNGHGTIVDVSPPRRALKDYVPEAQIYIEVDRQPDDSQALKSIETALSNVLQEVELVVSDFPQLKQALSQSITSLQQNPPHDIQAEELAECIQFLEWLNKDHFTFLGYIDYSLKEDKGVTRLSMVKASRLGLLKKPGDFNFNGLDAMLASPEQMKSSYPLLITKSDYKSPVHRPAHMDIIIVKQYNRAGKVIGEHRFVGLYTSSAYHSHPRYIPFLRRKVAQIVKRSGFDMKGHDGKAVVSILENYPRDELFQISEEQLYRTVIAIMKIQERQRIRLFVRKDLFGRFFFCMVYVPRDLFTTALRMKMQNILMREFHGIECTYSPNFLESVLCRIDFTIRVDPNGFEDADHVSLKRLESKLVMAARDWRDELRDSLIASKGEHEGATLYNKYSRAFPASYRERFLARSAITDIGYIENVLRDDVLGMCFYRMLEEPANFIHFKLFRKGQGLPLTDVLPILENMGLRVIEERPYEVLISPEEFVWISDFGMQVQHSDINLEKISQVFQLAFTEVWYRRVENDGFNRLVVNAGMSWQEVLIFRAYAKYLKQLGFPYSQPLIEKTLMEYAEIARELVALFSVRFDPAKQNSTTARNIKKTYNNICEMIDSQVTNLDNDRILRRYTQVIMATQRTNYYQNVAGPGVYVSFKLAPALIPEVPLPVPEYEIFVYSPRVQGVHLRGARVARGGLRWSDRREDFRTEVLGLMKAQQVKNAVIVPMGAKGGFVPQHLPVEQGREAVQEEGIACYKLFIRGLLDITDNLRNNKVIPPKNVVCHDIPDPYLVVAADKGTASFSDIANDVAAEYQFWLGDAFASGGSCGYDHKKMGITARGAWESVKRHFLALNVDTQSEDFTVVGIGDMSGDVFGNGMLLSKHIQLVAAFNHMHIFIDPQPDAAKSYAERKRLFNLPRSGWSDYNPKLISAGGGVFERNAKRIKLTAPIKKLFDITEDELEPSQLIRKILTAKVDLLWNGGIGTYVKASHQSNYDVGDQTNDQLRVDAIDLHCRVVGEGGNLGFTQLARIEYALQGGLIYTDAIDNSAGVDCSDHEVNIKILLNEVMRSGELTLKQRNDLLRSMENDVAQLVLRDNYMQTQAIDSGLLRKNSLSMHVRLLQEMEREKRVDLALEFLPNEKELKTREGTDQLTAPEFSVLMAYVKTLIKNAILDSTIPEEPYFRRYLEMEFPEILTQKYAKYMDKHRLRREIIATQLTNEVVHYMGITFVHRMYDETGATPALSARAFVVAFEIYDLKQWWDKVQALDAKVPAVEQYYMMNDLFRLARRTARWLLRNHRGALDVPQLINDLKPKVNSFLALTHQVWNKKHTAGRDHVIERYYNAHVPKTLANQVADFRYLSPALDIIYGEVESGCPLKLVAQIYYELSTRLSFTWLRTELSRIRNYGYWELLSGSALRDDLDILQRTLVISVLRETDNALPVRKRIDEWMQHYDYLMRRWLYMVNNLKLADHQFVQYAAAMRNLFDLAQVCMHGDKTAYRIQEAGYTGKQHIPTAQQGIDELIL